MALTTSNVKQIAVRRFFEGMGAVDDTWSRVVNYIRADVPSLRIAAYTGIPDPGTFDGTALTTAAIDSTGATSLDYQGYGVQVVLPLYDLADLPDLLDNASRKLGMSVASKRANLAHTLIANSVTDTIADGEAAVSSSHTFASGISGNRSNKLTSALDIASFEAAIKMARLAQNFQGQIIQWADVPKFLVVPAELEATAKKIIQSPFDVASNSQTFANIAGQYNTTVVVSPYLDAVDTNNWFLVADPQLYGNPFTYFDRALPDYSVVIDQDTRSTKLNVTFASKAASGPQPDGLIGSVVS